MTNTIKRKIFSAAELFCIFLAFLLITKIARKRDSITEKIVQKYGKKTENWCRTLIDTTILISKWVQKPFCKNPLLPKIDQISNKIKTISVKTYEFSRSFYEETVKLFWLIDEQINDCKRVVKFCCTGDINVLGLPIALKKDAKTNLRNDFIAFYSAEFERKDELTIGNLQTNPMNSAALGSEDDSECNSDNSATLSANPNLPASPLIKKDPDDNYNADIPPPDLPDSDVYSPLLTPLRESPPSSQSGEDNKNDISNQIHPLETSDFCKKELPNNSNPDQNSPIVFLPSSIFSAPHDENAENSPQKFNAFPVKPPSPAGPDILFSSYEKSHPNSAGSTEFTKPPAVYSDAVKSPVCSKDSEIHTLHFSPNSEIPVPIAKPYDDGVLQPRIYDPKGFSDDENSEKADKHEKKSKKCCASKCIYAYGFVNIAEVHEFFGDVGKIVSIRAVRAPELRKKYGYKREFFVQFASMGAARRARGLWVEKGEREVLIIEYARRETVPKEKFLPKEFK